MKDQQSEQKTAEELLIAKNAATKEIFHMPFEKAFIRIIVGDTNFTMSQVESVIDKTALLYASQQTASLQKQYNDLGVKYGKELERWIERDEEQREEIEKWKNLYEAERDINLQAIVTEQQQEIEYLQKQLEEQQEKLADLANTIRSKNNTLDEYEEEIERLNHQIDALQPKTATSEAVDPKGYATSAVKILHALNLVIGKDVNEWAMPCIMQIIENNVYTKEAERIAELEEALRELYSFTPDLHSPTTDWDGDLYKAILKAKNALQSPPGESEKENNNPGNK